MMRRVLFGGFVCVLAVSLLGPTALAAESADDCVAIQRTEQSDGLDFQLKNNCDRPLACTLAWTLSCESDKGKVVSTAKQSASLAIAKDTDKHVFGSATTCKTSGWRIDDVGWTCAPATK